MYGNPGEDMTKVTFFWKNEWGNKVKRSALDGIEEWARVLWLSQAKTDCPVDTGTMRNSLTVERSDAENCVYVGGGGAAKKYIRRQELDRSLHHKVGKAGFIRDSVTMHIGKIPEFIKRRTG